MSLAKISARNINQGERALSKSVVILGAGPAGLATAYYLCKGGFSDITILEKEKFVGGIAATLCRDDMLFDFGSHRIHPTCGADTLSLIRSLLGNDLLTRPRRGAIWLSGHIVEYPLRLAQVTSAVGWLSGARILASFAKQRLFPNSARQGQETSETLLVNRFGRAMFELFYEPYTTKVFGIPPAQMSPEQARRRVGSKSLLDIARKTLNIGRADAANPDIFLYPRHGFGQVCEALADEVRKSGVSIILDATPKKIVLSDARIARLEYMAEKQKHTLEPDFVFSTIPLQSLTSLCLPRSSPAHQAASSLKTRSLVLLYIVLNKDRAGEKDAYYFPSGGITFNRISEQKNFSPEMVPPGKTVLCADISCNLEDRFWRLTDEEVFQAARESLLRLGLFALEDVDYWFTRRVRCAYPVYSLGFEQHLRIVLDWADSVENLVTLGRQGLFAHNNFHHSVMMAKAAAEHLLSGKPKSEGWNKARLAFAAFKVID